MNVDAVLKWPAQSALDPHIKEEVQVFTTKTHELRDVHRIKEMI